MVHEKPHKYQFLTNFSRRFWIWPLFWGQRSRTRAQEAFWIWLWELKLASKTPGLYFGANCSPKINEYFYQSILKKHEFSTNYSPKVRLQGWLSMNNFVSLFTCFLSRVQNVMREQSTIRHSGDLLWLCATDRNCSISTLKKKNIKINAILKLFVNSNQNISSNHPILKENLKILKLTNRK